MSDIVKYKGSEINKDQRDALYFTMSDIVHKGTNFFWVAETWNLTLGNTSVNIDHALKGGFKSEDTRVFLYLQNKYSNSLSWAENLNKLFTDLGGKFKFSAQDSDLEYLSWRSKNPPDSSDLKPPLPLTCLKRHYFTVLQRLSEFV